MSTIRTENPALRDAETLQATLDDIRKALARRAVVDASQQLALLTGVLTLAIAHTARAADDPVALADTIVEATCGMLRREVGQALAIVGRPN